MPSTSPPASSRRRTPGEILLGELTAGLCASGRGRAVAPIAAKGKSEPVAAFRLLAGPPGAGGACRTSRSSVASGSSGSCERCSSRPSRERRCRARDVSASRASARRDSSPSSLPARRARAVLVGRCLSYGEGITYWPLGRDRARGRLDPRRGLAEQAARQARAALRSARRPRGLPPSSASAARRPPRRSRWAFATLCLAGAGAAAARAGRGRPLGGSGVARAARGRGRAASGTRSWCSRPPAPSATGTPSFGCTRSAEDEIARLLASSSLAAAQRAEVVRRSGGNPLFAEELAAYLRERRDAEEIPPTLSALLSARLDLLGEPERACASAAPSRASSSTAARSWHSPAMAMFSRALTAGRAGADPLGSGAVRRRSRLPLQARARPRRRLQRHREASTGRAARALRRLACGRRPATASRSCEEIVGYHLEQACRYRRELGLASEELAERAGSHLATAGRRALWRLDHRVAAALLERAAEMSRPLRLDVHLELDLARSHVESPAEAAAIAAAASERARIAGDPTGEALAQLVAYTSVSSTAELGQTIWIAACAP